MYFGKRFSEYAQMLWVNVSHNIECGPPDPQTIGLLIGPTSSSAHVMMGSAHAGLMNFLFSPCHLFIQPINKYFIKIDKSKLKKEKKNCF